MKIFKSIIVIIILFGMPLASWYFLKGGLDWRKSKIVELAPKGRFISAFNFENADIKNYSETNNDTESNEKSKWISENSFLFKDNIKHKLADCQLAQSDNKLYIVIRQQNKDDILLGYVIHSSAIPKNTQQNQNLQPINENIVNEL